MKIPESSVSLVDQREQLFDDGRQGQVEEISTKCDEVRQINGILLDLDPGLFKVSWLTPDLSLSPADFFQKYVRSWLERYPLLQKAEVRISGSGLHVILRLDKPINVLEPEVNQAWRQRVRVLQRLLPTDPSQPGINAMTRVVGSINGKNGAEVELLTPGEPVTEQELLEAVDELTGQPFLTITSILCEKSQADCPLCARKSMHRMAAQGRCYGCGRITLAEFMSTIYVADRAKAAKAAVGEEVPHA